MKIFAIQLQHLDENNARQQIERLKPFVSSEKRAAAERFRFLIDARRTLLGEVLVRQTIHDMYDMPMDQIVFETEGNGKPVVRQLPSFHFNLSHSGDWVVCAVDDAPVGIDIEEIKPIDLAIAKRFFSADEYQDLLSQPAERQEAYFFHLWSMKEAFIKLTGKGLSYGLSSFTARLSADGQASLTLPDHETACFVQTYSLDPAYQMAVCTRKSAAAESVEKITCSDVLSRL
ncbi:4'-phosphopantetheinyl transferase superfamily protein [Bacillus safensis]|uniref:4'-phosphopantetheinyl transferase family protein n=1 Tax=Bacillus safensis TaxID=561879 RepID=UPI0005C8705D|nr:4'-phosphopantetheinyl transferase superfamily protein [Bacillus safensis]KAB3538078.1 4'-phosphopantetheinyl transferase superfamily protein [Bacillus safensis]KAB3543933.1 4'-phosphopantetheinyl transferase superfamily protein [Bacillus safensis]KIZ55078.1 4'-phosphopantetheinyl transferase [Bacillus safensis]